MPYQDSTGHPLRAGDRVRWRGEEYTVVGFRPGEGLGGRVAAIDFDRPPHTGEVPDETSVDRITRQDPAMTNPTDPQTREEWQEAVDAADFYLHLHAARTYGLVVGGPGVDVARCEWVVAEGARRGVRPRPGNVERYIRLAAGEGDHARSRQ